MFCLYCGKTLPDNAGFCNYCGKRQVAEPGATSTSNLNQPASPSTKLPIHGGQSMSENLPGTMPWERPYSAPLNPTPTPPPPPFRNSPASARSSSGETFFSKHNLGTIIASVGGIVALLAFFFMPFVTIPLGIFGTYSFTGQQLASYGNQSATSIYSSQFQALQLLWSEPLAALIILGIAAYMIFKSTQNILTAQATKTAAISLITIATIMVVALFIRYGIDAQPSSQYGSSYSGPTLASYYSSGFWVYILSMLAVIAGGAIQLGQNRNS